MHENPFPFTGLSDQEVEASRQIHGKNVIQNESANTFWPALKETITEPMFLLLVAASVIYFLLGEISEGIFMLASIVLVSAISFYQDSRSRKALAALKAYTQAKVNVIRNGNVISIDTEDLVVGDYVVTEEGSLIEADGIIVHSHDFSVNESILTGEAFSVLKDTVDLNNLVYGGTTVVSGLAVYKVTQIGSETKLGKIGTSLSGIEEEKTPLQLQIGNFVKKMAIAGFIVFLLVWGINFYHSLNILDSLLKGLTLAMSILPEEIPVAFTTFMALGAWRLMKEGIIVKQTKTVETLGAATVICTDKTGTITENRMELATLYIHQTKATTKANDWNTPEARQLITLSMWASEPVPFDPMEKAIHDAYTKYTEHDHRSSFKLIHEYPLGGKPPMMTHVFKNSEGKQIIACKGAPESILRHSTLSIAEQKEVLNIVSNMAQQGFRVLGVGETTWEEGTFPKEQQQFVFKFSGLVGFYDPPKGNIKEVFSKFYAAGIAVKIITGDNLITTRAIASQANFKDSTTSLQGEDLIKLDDIHLYKEVNQTNIFTRMFPEAKLRIVNALKHEHYIVAMTGDGVNDGPALKAAHIGIAMGKRGSEIAKQASALILTDDDLGKMIIAIAMGRKIYNNLKKAIQYIISIHIPIILTVALPLLLRWIYPNIFTPVHVIFLELIMGPTCSIIYENEPLEKNSMSQPPRAITQTFLSFSELWISIVQGLVITGGTLICYQLAVQNSYPENVTRSMVFTTLVTANIILTLVNRSFYYSIITTFAYKNWMLIGIISLTILLLGGILYIPVVKNFFQMSSLNWHQVLLSSCIGFVTVIWFEIHKWIKRRFNPVSIAA